MKSVRHLAAFAVLALPLGIAQAQGNGAPSGPHYNLNIIGHSRCSGDDLKGTNRHVIQVMLRGGQTAGDLNGTSPVSLDKRNKIFLSESTDGSFQVMDGNACDGDGARFKLPAPGAYEIYARALGQPGGGATMTTCATAAGPDETFGTNDDEIVCSTENVVLVRGTGKSTFTNVTTQLTTIYADIDGDSDMERVNLFDEDLRDYFWNYDNRGLRLAQLRIYPNQSN